MAERAEPILSKIASTERRVEWSALALGLALLVQTGGIVWWGATLNQRVQALEEKISASADTGETIARLDERTASMQSTIDRLDRRLTEAQDRKDYGR